MNNTFESGMEEVIQFLNGKPGNSEILFSLLVAFAFSIVMWTAYRISHDKKSYQSEFGVTIIVLALISTVLMDLIRSNLALSLGMLGSLSIVRFRTNVKDFRDIGFIFWSMAIGIASATESYVIGIIGSAFLFIIMVTTKPQCKAFQKMLLVIRGSNVNLDSVQAIVATLPRKNNIKAKNVLSDSFELVYEVELRDKDTNYIVDELFNLDGIDSVNVLAQNA